MVKKCKNHPRLFTIHGMNLESYCNDLYLAPTNTFHSVIILSLQCFDTVGWAAAGVVICLERGADLHMAQLMPLPLIVSCFRKIQIGFTYLVLAHPGSPGKRAVKHVYVCMYVCNH